MPRFVSGFGRARLELDDAAQARESARSLAPVDISATPSMAVRVDVVRPQGDGAAERLECGLARGRGRRAPSRARARQGRSSASSFRARVEAFASRARVAAIVRGAGRRRYRTLRLVELDAGEADDRRGIFGSRARGLLVVFLGRASVVTLVGASPWARASIGRGARAPGERAGARARRRHAADGSARWRAVHRSADAFGAGTGGAFAGGGRGE